MASPHQPNGRSTRQRILTAAIELFSQSGFAGTSTRELCQAAGITKPVLYHYFATKEDLFRQIVEEALHEYGEGMRRAAVPEGTAEQRLVEVVWNDFKFTRQQPQLLRLLYRVVFAHEAVIPVEDVVSAAMEELNVLLQVARDGIRSGEWLGSPEEIGLSVLGLSHIHTLRYMVGGEGSLSRAQAQRCVEVALHGCGRGAVSRDKPAASKARKV
jgi:AcrR family transcriptional regulator